MRALQRNKRAIASAIANASGSATAIINIIPGPSWEVKQMAVTSNSTATTPIATTYVGTNSAGVFISQTLIGSSDTDSAPNVTVRTGESLCAIWSGCTAGDVCTLTVIYDEVAY